MNDKQKAIVLILLVAVLGGATSTITKIGLAGIPPLSFAFIRFLIAGVVVFPFLLKTNFLKDLKQLIPFSLLGTINIAYFKKKLESFSPLVVTSAFIWVTCFALLPLSLTDLIAYPNWWQNLTFSGVLSLGYVSIVSTVLVYLLNQYAIKHGGSVLASMQFYLFPVFAYLSAFLLLGEQLTLGLVVGGTLALLGVYIATKK